MKRKSTVLILDAGHGGIDTKGNYTTAPSKQKLFPKNSVKLRKRLYENNVFF